MSFNPIVIVGGEPKSIFLEIFLKAIKRKKKNSNPIILICSKNILQKNIEKFNHRLTFNELNKNYTNLDYKKINLINVEFKDFSFSSKKINYKSNLYLKKSFDIALKMKKINCSGLINGPVSKKTF